MVGPLQTVYCHSLTVIVGQFVGYPVIHCQLCLRPSISRSFYTATRQILDFFGIQRGLQRGGYIHVADENPFKAGIS